MIRVFLRLHDRLLRASDRLFVESAYRVLLGRPADPGGLGNAVAKLRAGYPRLLLVQDLALSGEFQQKTDAAREALDRKDYEVGGVRLSLYDVKGYPMRDVVVGELLRDVYGIETIPFAPGDIVIDVGGNLGIVSVYIAKKHPGVRVLLFEPMPETYAICLRNIETNGASNVSAYCKAVTADGRPLTLAARRDFLGGASAHYSAERVSGPDHVRVSAPSIALDQIFAEHHVDRCKLLKIDCEGSEHEILRAAQCLDRIDYLSGELHINGALTAQGHSIEALRQHCERFIRPERVRVTAVRMGE